MKTLSIFAIAALALVFLASCSTPQSRSQERSAAFGQLSSRQKEEVLKGKFDEGMNPDAVYIALGNPARIEHRTYRGQSQEVWVYSRLESYEVPGWSYRYYATRHGGYMMVPEYDPYLESRPVDALRIIFESNKVVGWERIP